MNEINFKHNWNNKLNCPIFTTIRKHNRNKEMYYQNQIGNEFKIMLNNKLMGIAVLREVLTITFMNIPKTILRADTGYFEMGKIDMIFKRFGIADPDEILILTFERNL